MDFFTPRIATLSLRLAAALLVVAVPLFLLNNYLVHWRGWPGIGALPDKNLALWWLELVGFGVIIGLTLARVATRARDLRGDAEIYARIAAYIIRAAFWAVFLIGVIDMLISFLRVEGFLAAFVGEYLTTQLGRPVFRGMYVHYPLLAAALVIAFFARTLGFVWLALLVVLAEFQIVIFRFVFSYEQAFMGDLVRFWYAALFLFASAYTLLHEGHVRVDVLYANLSKRAKAASNACGVLLLGLPVCWTILIQGMSSRGASITSPLLGFEISQSGFGMYVKYLMAGFLLVFAVSMAIQFVAGLLNHIADWRGEE